MSGRGGSAREALVAELLGDVQVLLERADRAEGSTKETTQALIEATMAYRNQVDEMVARLRSETATLIARTTEHAARSLVGHQADTLKHAATQAMERVLTDHLVKRTRRDWLSAAGVGGLAGSLSAILILFVSTFL